MSKYRQSHTQDNLDLLAMVNALRADIRRMIEKAIEQTSPINEEQFLAQVMTGNCPRCASNQLCHQDPRIQPLSTSFQGTFP